MPELRNFIDTNRADIDAVIAEAQATIDDLAAHELARRRGDLILICGVDLCRRNWMEDGFHASGEADYRRGYHHGYSQAMDDLRADCKRSAWQTLAEWFDATLTRWRFAPRPVTFDIPPRFVRHPRTPARGSNSARPQRTQ